MSMFDSQQDSFEKSVSEYRSNANSVAQGALGSMGSLAGDSRAMASSGASAVAGMDSSKIASTITMQGQNLAKMLGLDGSLPLTMTGVSKGAKFFGSGLSNIARTSQKMRSLAMDNTAGEGDDTPFNMGRGVPTEAGPDQVGENYSGPAGGNVKTFKPPPGGDDTPTPTSTTDTPAPTSTTDTPAPSAGGDGAGPAPPTTTDTPAPSAGGGDPVLGNAATDGGFGEGGAGGTNMAGTLTNQASASASRVADQASDQASAAATTAAEQTATTTAEQVASSTESAAAGLGETIAKGAGSFLSTAGGFLGDLLPIVGVGLAGYTLYESLDDIDKGMGEEGNDPYAKVRADLAQGQSKVQSMTAQISADQFSSKVGGAAPAFGSLAAPTFSTAQQMSGATGHF